MPQSPNSSQGGKFSIRRATNADQAAIRAVLHAVRVEYGVLHCEARDMDAELRDIQANYFELGGSFEVVEDAAGQIVGCAGLYPLNDQRAELCKMYILEQARGRGFGRRLLDDMLAAARRGGFTEVWLETNSTLRQAISLYREYGFQPVGSDSLLSTCDQAYLLRLT